MSRYQADDRGPYFCTVTVLDWIPVLIEARYIDVLIESLSFCRENKGLDLFALLTFGFFAAGEDYFPPDRKSASSSITNSLRDLRDFVVLSSPRRLYYHEGAKSTKIKDKI